MSKLESFSFGVNPIRVVLVAGEPHWVAKDVADGLGYSAGSIGNLGTLIQNVPAEWKGRNQIMTLGGSQEMLTLTEQGLYFFLGRSDKPSALPMQKWIAGEVLPSIRRTGTFGVVAFKVPQTLSEALRLAADLSDENIAHKATIATLEPKAAFSDRVALATDGQSVAEVAKILGTGQNRLYQWLRGKKFIMADNLPYQEHLDCGRFRVIEQTWEGKTSMHTSTKTLITGKGLIWLQNAWDADHMVDGVSA